MSALSWNCQGAGSSETVQRIRDLRRTYFPDLLFLMETKQQFPFINNLKQSLGYDDLVTVEPIGLSGGLAVMWKKCFQVNVLSKSNRIIDLKIKMGTISFFLTCVYGDPVKERRQIVWDDLSRIGVNRDEAWILIGDFNELMQASEKLGGPVRHERSFWNFRNMAENCKVKEVRSCGDSFSWAGWRNQIWVQCRLDRCFGNNEWFKWFPRAQVEYLDMWASDHRPIRLSFSLENDVPSRGRFFFDKRWLGKAGFEEAVSKGWSNGDDSNISLLDRIANCRRAIAVWKKTSDTNAKTKIQRLHANLEFEIKKARPNYQRMKLLKLDLAKAYHQEELFWRQKCREQWLKEGDLNTKYFHNCVKGRKLQNRVLMLLNEFDQEHFSEGAKGNIAVEYFRDLFMSTNPFDLESLFHDFTPRVTEDMNRILTAPITPEEIKLAAFSVKGSSAPGEDGITGVFYQKFWHIVGPSVIKEIESFFATSMIPDGWNHTHLCLLPKVPSPTRMTDMRPISLCSVQYKIISKILCQRLILFLPDIVSETQGAFVAGRLISDNILIAHEMVHGLRTVDNVAKNFMAIKTDMSKSYDRVEWCFLETLLEKLGFNRVWTRWVMACVTSVTYSVLLNGRSHGFIRPERGIRQGDPLFPFLFILAAEALVGRLNKFENDGSLHGIKLATTGPSIHHLLFADDSLLMCRANEEEAQEISRVLKAYGEVSGQLINVNKSSIIFGLQVPEDSKVRIKEVLGIHKEGGEGTYLGLPECLSGSKSKLLSFVQEKLQNRVNGWYAQTLSNGGKEVMIKSIALAMPIFAMSCFRLSKTVCAKITSVLTQFWWSNGGNRKKLPWVAWERLCKSKENGGLGFHDISTFNQALLGKQAWRIWSQPNSLLAQVLKHRYFKNGDFMDSTLGRRPSYAWRSILHGREVLQRGLVKQIGNGINTKFWLENWIMDGIPRSPRYIPQGMVDLTLSVSDFMDPVLHRWDLEKLRQVVVEEDVARIATMKISFNVHDRWMWGFTKDGIYSSRSGYKLLETIQNENNPAAVTTTPLEKNLWKNIWKTKAPSKLKHFLWKSLTGAIAVKARLASRGLQVDPRCIACGAASESICHVLFQCSTAKKVWELSTLPLPANGFSRDSVFLNLHLLISISQKKSAPDLVRLAFPWILWQLWKARNRLCFENVSSTPESIIDKALGDAEIWLLLNNKDSVHTNPEHQSEMINNKWIKPALNTLKCNVGASWSVTNRTAGAAWLLRDHNGTVKYHSKRSFANVSSEMESECLAMLWAIESIWRLKEMDVTFESCLLLAREALLYPLMHSHVATILNCIFRCLGDIQGWYLSLTDQARNLAALEIAKSVTRDNRSQSYIARSGPLWLQPILMSEARASSD